MFGTVMFRHSHCKNTGLETHEKVLLYVFHHVFFVSMYTLIRSRHIGKPNLNNACPFNTVLANKSESAQSFLAKSNIHPT